MRYHVLAADYDGTLATHGTVPPATVEAIKRLRASGRKFVLVTGREVDDVLQVFPDNEICDRIVAENGAVVYNPATKETQNLAEPPPLAFAEKLAQRIGQSVAVGRVIVATWQPHEAVALELINEMALELQIIFNKGAVMILPTGVNKAVGLKTALTELGVSTRSTVGVGDAENDHAFLSVCECGVAVANALPPLKERADLVTAGIGSEGVAELADRMLRDDLADMDDVMKRHHLSIGRRVDGTALTLSPYRGPMLLAGSSGGGKSTMATVLMEALVEHGYQSVIIDPEGDFRDLPETTSLGDAQHPPSPSEVIALLEDTKQNVSVSLIGVPLIDRPAYFESLMPHLLELRARTGRPHWIFVDETHHVAPADRHPSGITLPAHPHGLLYITVRPEHVAPALLESIDAAFLVGSHAPEALSELTRSLKVQPRPKNVPTPEGIQALAWFRADPGRAVLFERVTPKTERRRHVRKYATGELEPEKSFYFRGPHMKLNLRAHNLLLFMQLAEGVDADTWLHHLHQGDYSRWFRDAIRDPDLAEEAAGVEAARGLTADESRERIRAAIDSRYTAAA